MEDRANSTASLESTFGRNDIRTRSSDSTHHTPAFLFRARALPNAANAVLSEVGRRDHNDGPKT
jgi:hypothetical protein